jgi:adenine-specific DNA-methyltransferase
MIPVLAETYSRKLFLELAESFLTEVSRDTRTVSNVSSSFAEVTSLGSSLPLDLQLFEVKVSGSLDKRVAIASDAFKLMKHTASYRSLVAFYSEDTDQWRLSLLTAKPTLDNGKVVTKLSSPRRFSYLLGPGSKLTTPSKQLIAKGKVKDFDDLSNRFAVEVVNNEFYREVSKLYDELVGSDTVRASLRYPNQGEPSYEFAVRLIGRIIFCWFLREKRSSLDKPLISARTLSREAANQKNYYHSLLAPLFFEVLNKPVVSREVRFQQDHFASIPYLNGGLFNPESDDFYKFDKASQVSVADLVDISDEWLRKLFDLLELYNFTVDENTSYDVDLSIDPEMLGRIFENLLARINPETGETVRKGTGSFYTPREIVEYMVDQSLKEYLANSTSLSGEKIDSLISYDLVDDVEHPLVQTERGEVIEAFNSVRILDPACGSGAFPIGILQKIVFVLQQVDPDSKQWLQKQLAGAGPELKHHLEQEFHNKNFDYLRKLGVIRESIYGVDIQPIATEISRLRCFLTLIVDQSVRDDAPNRGIEPLPNLDFKFVTANSLIKLENESRDGSRQAGLFEDTSGITELKELRNEYFGTHSSARESLKLRFSQSQNQMLQRMIAQNSHGYASLTKKVSTWNPFSHHTTHWFDAEWMFGIADGFDIVIGNPPYYKENDDKRRFDELRDSECYQGKMDVWYLFGALGIDLLKKDGILCFIATNNWTTNAGASKFRNKVLAESKIRQLIDFGSYFVFESSSIQTMVMLFEKVQQKTYAFDYGRIAASKPTHQDMLDLLSRTRTSENTLFQPTIDVTKRIGTLLTFSDKASELLLEKIDDKGNAKLMAHEVANGIHPHFGYVSKKAAEKLDDLHKVGDGIFALSEREKNGLRLSTDEEKLVKPYYTTKQLGRYRADPKNDEWLIYTDSSFRNPKSMDSMPGLKKHLDQFREVITSSNHPYGLHRARDERFFTGEKIISLRKSTPRPVFTLTDFDCYVTAEFYVIKTGRIDLSYLSGLLNSKLIAFWLKNKGKMQGNNFQIDKEPLLAIPIRTSDPTIQEKIAEKVDGIYHGAGATPEIEAEIDQLVYELYGLTADDIKILESN